MPDEKEIKRSFIFRKDLQAGGLRDDPYYLFANPIYNKIKEILKNKNYDFKDEFKHGGFFYSLVKEFTPLNKEKKYLKKGEEYHEVFFLQTLQELKDISLRFNLPNKFDYNAFDERTRAFTTNTDWEHPYDPSRKDGFLICADMKDTYGKELSDLVKNEMNDLEIKFVEKYVNGIHIFLPKKYTSFPKDYNYKLKPFP
jgi:hypothetical protein